MITAANTIVDKLGFEEQQRLVGEIRDIIRVAPLFTISAGGLPMSVKVTNAGKVGWVADDRGGYRYQPLHPVTGKPWPGIPASWLELASRYATPKHGLTWDCAHIVWYSPEARGGQGAKLGEHRDKTEHDRRGDIVTPCFGDPADWYTREDEDCMMTKARLVSGNVVVFSGSTRHMLHSIGKVHYGQADMFDRSPLDKPGRVALSIRSGAGSS